MDPTEPLDGRRTPANAESLRLVRPDEPPPEITIDVHEEPLSREVIESLARLRDRLSAQIFATDVRDGSAHQGSMS